MGDLSQPQGAALKEIYFDTKHPSSFSSIESLYKSVKSKGITRQNVKEFLSTCEAYTLHKTALKKFPRRKIPVINIGDRMEIDLVDMRSLSKYNDNFKYLLMAVDCFSRMAYSIPLKTKTGLETSTALEKNFKIIVPRAIFSDSGTEFLNSNVRKLLKKYNIKFSAMTSEPHHCPFIERLNKTIKTRMYKYFTHYNTNRYIDEINNIVMAYNSARHSAIKMPPNEVNPENVRQVYRNNSGSPAKLLKPKKASFKTGDFVRISKLRPVFAKGFEANFSTEVFEITAVLDSKIPHLYRLNDLEGVNIKGLFYPQQIIKCSRPQTFKVDKLLKKRKRGGQLEYYVSFVGLPKNQNCWVLASDVENI